MLDQGQTITVDSVARSYALINFDGYKTERFGKTADGASSNLRVDHTPAPDPTRSARHLVQLVRDVSDGATKVGKLTINVTVSAPDWIEPEIACDEWVGLKVWITTNLPRILQLES